MKKYITPLFIAFFAFLGAITLVQAYGRTVTDPATGSTLSSSVMRGLLQALENEVQWATSTVGIYSGTSTNVGIGTTSPYAKLSVVGEIVGAYFTGTTTATSTFGGNLVISGTGTTTSAGGISLSGGCFYVNGACLSSGGSQTPITQDIDYAGFQLTNGGHITATYFTATSTTATSTFRELSFTNATGTNLSVTGSSSFAWLNSASSSFGAISMPSITDSLLWTNGSGAFNSTSTGLVSAGTGISVTGSRYAIGGALTITNDGVTSISATSPLVNNVSVGAVSLTCPTCSTFPNPFPLSATTTLLAFNGGLTTTNATSSASFYSNLLQSLTARFTNLTATGTLTLPTIVSQTLITDANGLVSGTSSPSAWSFTYSTTTATAATETIPVAGAPWGRTFNNFGCTSNGGTANVQAGDGSASTTMVTSATGNTTTFIALSSNNAFISGEVMYVALGTWSGTGVRSVYCSASVTKT